MLPDMVDAKLKGIQETDGVKDPKTITGKLKKSSVEWFDPLITEIVKKKGQARKDGTIPTRTIDAVLREVERWHDQMNRYRPLRRQNLDKITWEGDQIEDWIFEEHRGGDKPNRVWCFQQILCAKELLDEGRSQSHCVSSYIETCRRGQCSIWTMRDDGERALTIEIRDKTIRQARGKRNRQPTFKEIQILKRFASEKNLTVGRWIENGGGW